jgi:hypothetical protein
MEFRADMMETVLDLSASEPRISRPQQALRYDMELPFRRTLYPLGFAVNFLTNRTAVLDAAEASFGHMQPTQISAPFEVRIGVSPSEENSIPPLPVRREFDHLYSMVADTENQAILDLHTGTNFVWLSEAALIDPLYLQQNFLEKVVYLLLGATVVTDIHAGCVGKYGKSILLCGDSGAGKSTLSYACARAGWTFTSDDTCYLLNTSEIPRVIGHAHRMRFRPSAKAFFPELRDLPITPRMEGKPSIEVPISQLPPIHTSVEVEVHAVIYLHRGQTTTPSLFPLTPGSASARMSNELYSAGTIRKKHEQLLQKFSMTPTYELQYCNLDEAIQELDRFVASL